MVELGWTTSEVMQENVQNLESQGYMAVAALVTCCMPEDPTSPFMGGYIMACTAFYEWWFGVPSHQFLYSLLQLYGLELHHLTPSGTLHKETFVTLYESYMGIEPHFNMWNYFFHTQLQQGSSAEMAALGSVDIFV
jgi:hypothetical protein